MKKPPPINQLHPEDHIQQFHNAHMFEDDGNHPTALGSVLRHGHLLASGGTVPSPVVERALKKTAPDRPMVALAELFQRQLRGRPPS